MAYYARKSSAARAWASQAEQVRRVRSKRPLIGDVPALAWGLEGDITFDRFFVPQRVTNDPRGLDERPTWKRIVAVEAYLFGGELDLAWNSNNEESLLGVQIPIQTVSGITNYFELEEPYVITNGSIRGELFWPSIADINESVGTPIHLSATLYVDVVPV